MYKMFYFVCPAVLLLGIIRKYREMSWGRYRGKESLAGKVFIVTGANCGLGKETARELVARHAKVIMACRDVNSAKQTILDLRRTISTGEIIPLYLDLASIVSIKTFADIVLRDFQRIDVLINNAGVSWLLPQNPVTEDGFELHFGVNYLGPFLLTKLLLERLKESAPSRIVNVTSKLLEKGKIDLGHLNDASMNTRDNNMNLLYCNSKLELAYFGWLLKDKMQGTGVTVYTVSPGFCWTRLMRHYNMSIVKNVFFAFIAFFFMRTPHQGAQGIIHCALSKDLENQNGWLYRDMKEYTPNHIFDAEMAKKLWQRTEAILKHTGKL